MGVTGVLLVTGTWPWGIHYLATADTLEVSEAMSLIPKWAGLASYPEGLRPGTQMTSHQSRPLLGRV